MRAADITTAEMTMATIATTNHPRDLVDSWGLPLGSISPVDQMGANKLNVS
jgi:hypothetical protein